VNTIPKAPNAINPIFVFFFSEAIDVDFVDPDVDFVDLDVDSVSDERLGNDLYDALSVSDEILELLPRPFFFDFAIYIKYKYII